MAKMNRSKRWRRKNRERRAHPSTDAVATLLYPGKWNAGKSEGEGPPFSITCPYAEFQVTAADRDDYEKGLDTVRLILATCGRDECLSAFSINFRAVVKSWILTPTEAAGLLRTAQPVWKLDGNLAQFDAETMYRIWIIDGLWVDLTRSKGEAETLRWLREPDQHPTFQGVVPIHELSNPDTVQIDYFRLYVHQVHGAGHQTGANQRTAC